MKRRVILIIQDGWGIAPDDPGNMISQAKTPFFDSIISKYPHCKNEASGNAVGLPTGAQGNSEVGHLTLGAGRIVWQMYELINRSIRTGEFLKNPAIIGAMGFSKANDSALHLMGLCSDEGVHSHTDHLLALLDMAKQMDIQNVYVHFFADGRDVHEKSALKYVDIIEKKMKELRIGRIASVVGRYYAMDRDNNWDRTQAAYDMLTLGLGFRTSSATEAINTAYKRGDKTDYYIQPTVIEGFVPIRDNDTVIFFNFRTDRPRQLTKAFTFSQFEAFKREKRPKTHFMTMTRYDKTFKCPSAFEEEQVSHNLGKVLSENGLRQIRIAETEKYAHVTYFFNSQLEKPYKGEARVLIPSPKVPSYDLKPEMSAAEITEESIKKISSKRFDFILINFANCDLVGHSAVKEAVIKAVEVVDNCTEKVIAAALANQYTIIITADHGSAEDKLYPDGKPKPAHSTNLVNFILISNDDELKKKKLVDGGQKDVAPTILELMGLEKPGEMTGKSLMR